MACGLQPETPASFRRRWLVDFVSHVLDPTTHSLSVKMVRIYAPALGLQTWQARLADPEKHWVRGKSAFETAVYWEVGARRPRGLHPTLTPLLDEVELLRSAELVASFPEHKVRLPGGSRASQSDVWAILRTVSGLASMAVEGKAGESFASTVGEWRGESTAGRDARLKYLCQTLGVPGVADSIRYQLLHRAASALIEAERIGASAAILVVLSFATDPLSKRDFDAFGGCVGATLSEGRLCRATSTKVPLFLGWLDLPLSTDQDIASIAV